MPPSSEASSVFCVCRRPDDGSWMIACENCDEWFHGKCIELTEAEGDLALMFYCDACQDRFGFESQWKPKCRLPGCFEPAAIEKSSKYCSTDHAIAFFRECITGMAGVSEAELAFLVSASDSMQKFKTLGEAKPSGDTSMTAPFEEIAKWEKDLDNTYQTITFLEDCKEAKRQLSQEATTREGAKRDICAFNPRLSDPSLEAPEVCMLEQRKCTQHKQWPVIFQERLFIKQQQAQKRLTALQNAHRALSQVEL